MKNGFQMKAILVGEIGMVPRINFGQAVFTNHHLPDSQR